jgi:hypothetical protein
MIEWKDPMISQFIFCKIYPKKFNLLKLDKNFGYCCV